MKPDVNYSPDDILTIAETRARLGSHYPARDAFHKAINNGRLKKVPESPEKRDVRIRWGDTLDYIEQGGFKKHGLHDLGVRDVVTSSESDDEAPPSPASVAGRDASADYHPADVNDCEVVPVEMELLQEGFAPDLKEVETLLIELPNLSTEDLINKIRSFAGRAEKSAMDAVKSGSRALIYAWACGTMLNKTKSDCKHGEFSQWIEEHLQHVGISTRTCQRYMKIARKWPDLSSFTKEQNGLKAAYVACGILQNPQDACGEFAESSNVDSVQNGDHSKLTRALLSGASTLQMRLRQFNSAGVILSPEDSNKLGEVVTQLASLYQIHQPATGESQSQS